MPENEFAVSILHFDAGIRTSPDTSNEPTPEERATLQPAQWQNYNTTLEKLAALKQSPCFVIASINKHEQEERARLKSLFGITLTWTDYKVSVPGYYRTGNVHQDNSNTTILDSELVTETKTNRKERGGWDRLKFCTIWNAHGMKIIFCFRTSHRVRTWIKEPAMAMQPTDLVVSPFVLHCLTLSAIVKSFDLTTWTWVNQARDLERRSNRSSEEFESLGEFSKGAAQNTVAINTTVLLLDDIIDANASFGKTQGLQDYQRHRICNELISHRTTLKVLQLRSQAVETRLSIQNSLDVVSQTERIAHLSDRDNAVTKLISVAGLLFLPGTFLSAIFSMSFFNYTPATGDAPGRWTVSDRFWIYWVVAIPLTVLTFIFFNNWQNTLNKHRDAAEAGKLDREQSSESGNFTRLRFWPGRHKRQLSQQHTHEAPQTSGVHDETGFESHIGKV